MLVHHRVPNIQDGGRKPKVGLQIIAVTDTDVVPKPKWGCKADRMYDVDQERATPPSA